MPQQDTIIDVPPPVETGDLHFKLLSKFKLFDGSKLSFDSNTSLLAVSQYYGLTFVGTNNGFLILNSKEILSGDNSNEGCYLKKEVLLNSRTSHLVVSFEQKHLAVGCQTKMGPIIYIYEIGSFLTKGVTPIKTVPLSKPFQNPVIQLCDVMWQPNNFSGLTACFSDGSVSALSLFQGNGNDIFSLPNTTQARCLCYSPKGKQIVIGSSDGTLSQYMPDLKFIKKLPVPPVFSGTVSVVNVLWISSFWFLAAYKNNNKAEEFPSVVIINASKNEPIKYFNYDDITFSSTFFRNHQLYFSHLSAWNVIFLASANSIEVAVLHSRGDNSIWEQWLLGDASRAELPLNADKVETFPIGIALDYTSDRTIPWGEELLPPAPRLLLLSSEGLLVAFNVLNLSKGHPVLTSPPKETFDSSWFTITGKNDPLLPTEMSQSSMVSSVSQASSLENAKPMQASKVGVGFSSPANVPLLQSQFAPFGYNNYYGMYSKEQAMFPNQQMMLAQQSPLVSQQPYLTNNTMVTSSQNFSSTSRLMSFSWMAMNKDSGLVKDFDQNTNTFSAPALTPKESVNLKDAKENLTLQEPTQTVKFNETPTDAVRTSSSAFPVGGQNIAVSTTTNLKAEQNASNKNLKTSPSRNAAELMAVSSKIYVTALTEEVDHFDTELKDVLSRLSALRVHIGTDEEKLNLRRSIEKLNEFEKKLHDTTSGQKNEIHSIKSDVIEAFAWLENARSRNRQRKSRTYIELKKSEDLDPMSSRIMSEISHLKYYIENQLKQLHSYLMREWMEHENNCRIDIKNMMIVPSMEELYKTMHLELKILNKLRATVEDLRHRVTERNMKIRSQTALIDDSVDNYSKPVDESSRMSELYKLADNLLQIKISKDETDAYINITDAFQLMIKNQINEIVERSKKFTVFKQNILRDTFCEREMMKTRSVKSKFGSSYFIRNSSSRIDSKYIIDSKTTDSEEIMTRNIESDLEEDNAMAQKSLQSTLEQEEKDVVSVKSANENKMDSKEIPVTEQSNTVVPAIQELPKHVITFGTPSFPNKSEAKSTTEFSFTALPNPTTTSSTVTGAAKSESKASPFVFKGTPVFSFGSSTQSQKLSVSTSGIGLSTGNTQTIVSSDASNTSVFTFKAAEIKTTASTTSPFTLPTVKTSSSFSPKTCTSFSTSSEVPAVITESSVLNSSDTKISTATSTTCPVFSFSNSISASASSSITAPSSSSASVFKFTTSAGPIFKFTTSAASFTFQSPFNLSKNNSQSPALTFSVTSPVLSTASTNVTASSEATSSAADTVNLSSKPNFTFKGFSDANKEASPEKAASEPRLGDKEAVLSTATMIQATTTTITNVTASTTCDIGHPISTVTTVLSTPTSEGKTEPESGKSEPKENIEGNAVTAPNVIIIEKSTGSSDQGKTELGSIAFPGFSQQPATQALTRSTAVADVVTVSSTSSSAPSTTTVSFSTPSKSIFSQPISISTTSSIFSTTGSSIFSSAKPATTNAELFSAAPVTTAPTSSIFGATVSTTAGASPFAQTATTSSTSTFVQSGKDEVGKTTELFGDMLRSGLATGSVFETPSTNVSGNIFGKSSFEKSGSSIFGNTGTAVTPATTAGGLFENTSNNIFMKSSFGQSPSSNMSNVFGQPQGKNNSFFGQNICSPFGSTTTTTPNQNPFASPSGFNSRPVFGQSLFGQSNTGQNPLERSSTTNIFGNSSISSPSGGNIFQMGSSSFQTSSPAPFSSTQSTSPTSAFQKPIGGFGGSPVFGSGLATTATFGAPPTFGGASTFGSPASFGSSQKIFGSPQGTFGQNQPNFESLASESTDGFADLAQRSQGQTFGGSTFNQNATFGGETSFGGKSFSSWRS